LGQRRSRIGKTFGCNKWGQVWHTPIVPWARALALAE
jgi:hypothetical protein